MEGMTAYEPSPEVEALFARHKRQKAALAKLDGMVKKQAIEEMRERGATTADLAERTGISDETFRRLARLNGIDRKRDPTVGKDAKPKAKTEGDA
jgi:transposase-like protein